MKPTENNTKTPHTATRIFAALRGLFHVGGSGASKIRIGYVPIKVLLATFAVVLGAFALTSAPALAETCPNEQLRAEDHSTELPDCRAYELVSPAFKYGEPAGGGHTLVAGNGEGVAFSSLGTFGELESAGSGLGGVYVARREGSSGSGWPATPVNPPADGFYPGPPFFENDVYEVGGETLDLSADLGESLFAAAPRTSTTPEDFRFYVRDGRGGFSEVGPVLSPEAIASQSENEKQQFDYPQGEYEGATGNLEHVLFSLLHGNVSRRAEYWPGDHTFGLESLYEYRGVGSSEPELVAVENHGSVAAAAATEHKAHINEAAEQIGQCGSAIGGGFGGGATKQYDGYNAVSTVPASEEGRVVYFTAFAKSAGCEEAGGTAGPAVNELFARIGASETVAISEPTTGPAGDCEGCVESEPKDALFQGASADGSRVFFLSEQKLFAGANGEAGDNLYEYNFNASDVHEKISFIASDLASDLSNPSSTLGGVVRVAEDGSRVYFVSTGVLASNRDALGLEATEGTLSKPHYNLYVRDTESGVTTFIGELSKSDSADWNETDVRPADATPDGRFLVFTSAGDLTPGAQGNESQVYRYDAETGVLLRVSIGEDGYGKNGNDEREFAITGEGSTIAASASHASSVSADGGRVVFSGASALTPHALDDVCAYEAVEDGQRQCLGEAKNIYEWEEPGLGSCPADQAAGCVSLISNGQDAHAVLKSTAVSLVGISASGDDVFFTTADSLVGQDTDGQQDLYDARVDGGFPAPTTPPECQGEGCQGAAAVSPVFGAPASTSFTGAGNLTPPSPAAPAAKPKSKPKAKTCKKGFVKRKSKCVKDKKAKKAGHNGRGK